MSYKLLRYNTPNKWAYNDPQMIIIHHWGADYATFDGTVSWLCDIASGVSAHFVAKAGVVAQLAKLTEATWHCVGKNQSSIGIECAPKMTTGDMDTVAELIADIWKQTGKILPLHGHLEYNITGCPGRWQAKLKTLYDMALTYYKGNAKPEAPKPVEVKKLVEDGIIGYQSTVAIQKWVNAPVLDGEISGQLVELWRFYPAIESATFEGGGSKTIINLQKMLKVEQDGYLGKDTATALQKFLNKEGYKLDVDGYFGVKSAKALQNYLNKKVVK